MGEDNSYNVRQNIIQADLTLSIQMPKLSFLFPENEEFTGHWELLDIGISREYIAQAETRYFITEEQEMRQLIRPRRTFAHKGNFGHGLLIAGSYGMGRCSRTCCTGLHAFRNRTADRTLSDLQSPAAADNRARSHGAGRRA